MTESNLVVLDGGEEISVEELREEAEIAHAKLLDLKRNQERTYLEIAKVLYEVGDKKLYRAIGPGFKSFDEYAENALAFSSRKAKYLCSVWWWFAIKNEAHPKVMELATDIGWSKAKELVEVVDSENVDAWGEIARGPRDKLMNAVRAARDGSGRTKDHRHDVVDADGNEVIDDGENTKAIGIAPPSPEDIEAKVQQREEDGWKRMSFDVTQDMRHMVDLALSAASELAKSKHNGHLLSLICTKYMSGYEKNSRLVLNEMLDSIQERCKVKLVALEQGQVIYGMDVVNALAGDDSDDGDES